MTVSMYIFSLLLQKDRQTAPFSSSIIIFFADSIIFLVLKSNISQPFRFFSANLFQKISRRSYQKFSYEDLMSLNLSLLNTFVLGFIILTRYCLVPRRLGRKIRQHFQGDSMDDSQTFMGFNLIRLESQVVSVYFYLLSLMVYLFSILALYLYYFLDRFDQKTATLRPSDFSTENYEATLSLLFLALSNSRFSLSKQSQICFSIERKEVEATLTRHSIILFLGMTLQRTSLGSFATII